MLSSQTFDHADQLQCRPLRCCCPVGCPFCTPSCPFCTHRLLSQSPVDTSCCRVQGVPVELNVLPQLLRPSNARYVRTRGGTAWDSLQTHAAARRHDSGCLECMPWPLLHRSPPMPACTMRYSLPPHGGQATGSLTPSCVRPPASPEKGLALHNLIWCERLFCCHEHKNLNPEGF